MAKQGMVSTVRSAVKRGRRLVGKPAKRKTTKRKTKRRPVASANPSRKRAVKTTRRKAARKK
jgi:hypothetical protein